MKSWIWCRTRVVSFRSAAIAGNTGKKSMCPAIFEIATGLPNIYASSRSLPSISLAAARFAFLDSSATTRPRIDLSVLATVSVTWASKSRFAIWVGAGGIGPSGAGFNFEAADLRSLRRHPNPVHQRRGRIPVHKRNCQRPGTVGLHHTGFCQPLHVVITALHQ